MADTEQHLKPSTTSTATGGENRKTIRKGYKKIAYIKRSSKSQHWDSFSTIAKTLGITGPKS